MGTGSGIDREHRAGLRNGRKAGEKAKIQSEKI
jgi:hypothetical protein